MGTLSLRPKAAAHPDDIRCQQCNKPIWLAEERLLLARVTRFPVNSPAEACCKICKSWVAVPVGVMPAS